LKHGNGHAKVYDGVEGNQSFGSHQRYLRLMTLIDILVAFLFAIFGLAIIAWLVVVFSEMIKELPSITSMFTKIFGSIFSAAPAKSELKHSHPAVKVSVGGLLPIVLWLLILLPMIILPIVLILFPMLGIPWSRLMPVAP
jgi:hypothetical protein